MGHIHTIEIGTTEDVDPKYLIDVLMWGLQEHNEAVAKFEESAGSDLYSDEDKDHPINPTYMSLEGSI